jgi:hypothetical protein
VDQIGYIAGLDSAQSQTARHMSGAIKARSNRRRAVMVQMVMNMAGATLTRDSNQQRSGTLARKMLGLAIVSSGYAVLIAHGLQHAFGG